MPGQSWDPASPALLMILLLPQELPAFVLPHHDLCLAASARWGEETLRGHLSERMHVWKKTKQLLYESRS